MIKLGVTVGLRAKGVGLQAGDRDRANVDIVRGVEMVPRLGEAALRGAAEEENNDRR